MQILRHSLKTNKNMVYTRACFLIAYAATERRGLFLFLLKIENFSTKIKINPIKLKVEKFLTIYDQFLTRFRRSIRNFYNINTRFQSTYIESRCPPQYLGDFFGRNLLSNHIENLNR
jgi:hypothetical protein